MYEYSTKGLDASSSMSSLLEMQKLTEQELLASFQGSVAEASRIGYAFEVPIKVGDWELIFSPAREIGGIPLIKHAVNMP